MPHPKGHVKLSGDTHLPDAEGDDDLEEGRSATAALARERGTAGRHHRRGGVLTADDSQGRMAVAAGGTGVPGASTDGSLAEAARGPVAWQSPAARAPGWVKPVALGLAGL